MPSFKTILQIAAATMATMYVVNMAIGTSPAIRKLFRGNGGLTVVGGTDSGSTIIDSTLGSS